MTRTEGAAYRSLLCADPQIGIYLQDERKKDGAYC